MKINGAIKIQFTDGGYKIQNGGGVTSTATFHFLQDLDHKGYFKNISNGPYATAHWIELDRLPDFLAYCETHGFEVTRAPACLTN
jgi:hypothetical protein